MATTTHRTSGEWRRGPSLIIQNKTVFFILVKATQIHSIGL